MLEWLDSIHWAVVGSIILIDILLGGDNAVIIALASRNLPANKRMHGILWGTAGALIMRVVLVFFAMTLLKIPFVKVVGALLLLWIGIKLLLPDHDDHDNIHGGATVWSAVKTILVADFVMSLDNVLAIAGAAQKTSPDHEMGYVILGLLVSVPIIIWGSTLVLKLIDRFPIVVIFGAGLLGWIAGGMLVTDIKVVQWLFSAEQLVNWIEPALACEGLEQIARMESCVPSAVVTVKYVAEVVGALLVVGLGLWLGKRRNGVA